MPLTEREVGLLWRYHDWLARHGYVLCERTKRPEPGLHGAVTYLGCELDMLKRICAEDKAALDMLDKATKGRQGERTDLFDNVQEVRPEAPTGDSTAASLRRLRKNRPDLHARVLAGEMSPHAAAVEAGFRRRILCVPADPAAAARTLRRHFSAAQLDQLIVLLQEEG